VHVAACITFAIAFMVSLTIWSWSTHPVKRALAVLVSLINWVAFVTYAAQVAGKAPAMATRTAGDVMQPFRFLQWSFTTPLLICALTSIAGDGPVARKLLRRGVACDLLMLLTGFGERFAANPVRSLLFGASSAAFAGTMLPMAALFRLASSALSAPEDAASLAALWRHTLTMWSLFPAARAACVLGLLGPNAEEVVMALLDILAKTGYSIVLMAGTFTLVDQMTERRLTRAEELLAMIRESEAAANTGLADGLTAAYREAEAWRAEREARLAAAGVPESTAAAFLDAAVGEYVALAQGRLDAWGLPTLRPPT
jgi:bacteriorhodopsin